MQKGSDPFSKGFTLIEVIVSLVLVAIVGAMVVSFMGTAVTRSADPLLQVQQGHYLNQIMENITADYKRLLATDDTPLFTLESRIGSIESEGRQYYAAANHPYTKNLKRISFDSNGLEIDSPGSGILKVTIFYRGLSLTALFTQ